MAVRTQDTNNVMRGRIQEIKIMHTGSESIWLSEIKNGNIAANEEVKSEVFELVDGQEIQQTYGRKIVAELQFDELVQADISKISDSDYAYIATPSGSGAGAGRYLEISGSDFITAHVSELGTKIIVEKSVSSGLPYTIGDR